MTDQEQINTEEQLNKAETAEAQGLTEEQQAELDGSLADIAAQLQEIDEEADASRAPVLAGLDELRERFGDDAVDAAAAGKIQDSSGRITELEAQLAGAQEEILRGKADLSNLSRRASQNEQQARKHGQSEAVKSLLGVLDHFDLTLGHVDPEQATAQSVLDGVQLIRTEMVRVLGTLGVEVLNPQAGEAFDPNKHAAIVHQPTGDYAPGSVVNVARAGYSIGGQIIRPAEVVVAAALPEAASEEVSSEEGGD